MARNIQRPKTEVNSEVLTTQYFTVKEVAKYFKIKPTTICNWIYRKNVNPVRIGGSLRFTLEELRRIESAGVGLLGKKD